MMRTLFRLFAASVGLGPLPLVVGCGADQSDAATAACSSDLTDCPAGGCVNLATDRANCGECAHLCGESEACVAGKCEQSCPKGTKTCAARCIDTSADPANCGECGHACAQGQVCALGTCALSCPSGFIACQGSCINPRTDPAHCGATGNCEGASSGKACESGHVCSESTCSATCQSNETNCNGACVDLQSDPMHCGKCAWPCSPGSKCIKGTCAVECPAGQSVCDGFCTTLDSDPYHCGSCETACAFGQACVNGACSDECPPGFTECSGACKDFQSDPGNCGSCAHACDSGLVCYEGQCTLFCPTGTELCGTKCAVLSTDPKNCGTCGNACPANTHAVATCDGGVCGTECEGTWADCDGDGGACEVDLSKSTHNCGSCGNVCYDFSSGSAVCSGMQCGALCFPQRGDCDDDLSNGCEAHLSADPMNCGHCGNICSLPFCDNGFCSKTVFVTSTVLSADFGGLAAADAECNARAQAAGLAGTYQAWLSTDAANPVLRLPKTYGPYRLPNGTMVAYSWESFFDGSLMHAINLTEYGTVPEPTPGACGQGTFAFTGTNYVGDAADTCGNWTSVVGKSALGDVNSSYSSWTSTNTCGWDGCTVKAHLYCFEE